MIGGQYILNNQKLQTQSLALFIHLTSKSSIINHFLKPQTHDPELLNSCLWYTLFQTSAIPINSKCSLKIPICLFNEFQKLNQISHATTTIFTSNYLSHNSPSLTAYFDQHLASKWLSILLFVVQVISMEFTLLSLLALCCFVKPWEVCIRMSN